MRGQYSIEVILIVVAFLSVISIFAGLYLQFAGDEENLGTRAQLKLEVNRIGNAVNHVYVMGPGNSLGLDIALNSSVLVVEKNTIKLESGGIEVEKTVFANLGEKRIENPHFLFIKNNGSVKIEGTE